MTAAAPAAAPHDDPRVVDLVRRTRAFVREVVMPAEPAPGERLADAERDRLQEAARAAGLLAPQAAAEWGGGGLPLRHWSPVLQEAGYSPIGPVALGCMAPDEGNMYLLERIATPEQQERWLRPLVEARIRSCFAMTEPHPGAGSDPDALASTAEPVGDGRWILRGEKRFISGAVGASVAIVMARTSEIDGQPAGATMFLVPTDTPGFRIGRQIHAMDRAIAGGHPHVHLDDVEVGPEAVLGEVGRGFRYAQVRLGPARLTHCMRWLGLARRAHDIALDRIGRREIFGSRIGDLGIAQDLISRSEIALATSSSIIDATARLLETDPKAGSALSSIAKVHCAEAIHDTIDRAMQLCGGDGMSDELPLASYLAEVRPFRVYDGSTETHRWAIARRALARRTALVESGAEPFLAEVAES